MARRSAGLALCCLAALAGCAGTPSSHPDPTRVAELREEQLQAALTGWLADRARLQRVAYRLFGANAAACGASVSNLPEALWLTRRDFPEPLRRVAEDSGYGDLPRVVALLGNAQAGGETTIQAGDVIVAVMGHRLPSSRRADRQLTERLAAFEPPASDALMLSVQRAQRQIEVPLSVRRGCRFDLKLARADAINAYADGSGISVTRGMMRFIVNDDELAFVIAHEMAHNLTHSLPKRLLAGLSERFAVVGGAVYRAATLGRLAPLAPRTYAQVLEVQADHLALRYLRAADYDAVVVVDFWRRLGALHPRSVAPGYVHSHPTSPERLARLEQQLLTSGQTGPR